MSTQYAFGQIVTNGLVLSLDAADKNSYPGSGTVWNDLTANKYIGTLTNGPTFSSTNNGAIVLDGVNDYVPISPESSGSAAGSFTWEVWYRPLNLNNTATPFNRGRDVGASFSWSLTSQVSSSTGQFIAAITTTSAGTVTFYATSSMAAGVTASAGIWSCIVGTWTAGSKIDLYINGAFAGTLATATTSLRTSTTGWNVGSLSDTTFSTGSVAASRVYNRVLSADEIKQNYEALKSRFGL
jgi:hypothetical protein